MNPDLQYIAESRIVPKCIPDNGCPVSGLCSHLAKPIKRDLHAQQRGPNPVSYAWRDYKLCNKFELSANISHNKTQ